MEKCPLCYNRTVLFSALKNRNYYQCPDCKGIFMGRDYLPDRLSEMARYKEHNNDVNDIGYQKFTSPIVDAILEDFSSKHRGLDFGAGTGPVISKMLTDKNYHIEKYDPFFYNAPGLLRGKYDYIACCEVIEHFHQPGQEFKLLYSLLRDNGKLYCMTSIYDESIDFKSWYYKNDNTHAFFYQKETLWYIKETFGFGDLKIANNMIIFSRMTSAS